MGPFCQLYTKNWIDQNSDDVDWLADCRKSLDTLVESGTFIDAQNAQMALTLLPFGRKRSGRFEPQAVRMGGRVVCDGFTSTEITSECLTFHAIDYGDKVRMNDTVKRKLHTSDTFEINQCTNLHLAAAIEWHCAGRASRPPSNHRVGFLAKEFREIELLQSEEAALAIGTCDEGISVALRCLIHDVISPHHDRDYRALSCFLLQHVRSLCKSSICVVELNEQARRAAVYCFDPNDHMEDESMPLFLLAHRGHLEWLKPSSEITPSLMRTGIFNLIKYTESEVSTGESFYKLTKYRLGTLSDCMRVDTVKLTSNTEYRSADLEE